MSENGRWPNGLEGKSWLVVTDPETEFRVVGITSGVPLVQLDGKSPNGGNNEPIIYIETQATDQAPTDDYIFNETGALTLEPETEAHIFAAAKAIQDTNT